MELKDHQVADHVEIVDSVVPFEGPIFTIRDDEVRFSSSDQVRRQYMEHDDAVAIVALREGSAGWEILLIRQYRHAPRRILWEIPAGLRDEDGESPVTTAARELSEEADVKAGRWYKLVSFLSSPGCSTEDLDIFLAMDIEDLNHEEIFFEREAEEREIEKTWAPLDDVLEAVLRGDLHSPTLVTGVLAVSVALARGLETLETVPTT